MLSVIIDQYSGGSRPSDKRAGAAGGGRVCGHQDPEK